jgi:hypothetical protein
MPSTSQRKVDNSLSLTGESPNYKFRAHLLSYVNLSAAKDLDGRDDRRQPRKPLAESGS